MNRRNPESKPIERRQPFETAPDPSKLIMVGRVLGPRGLAGEMRVEPLSSNPARFVKGARLVLAGEWRQLAFCRLQKDHYVLRIEGIDTPEAVQALRSEPLYAEEATAPALQEDWYYHYQLLGLTVVTEEGRTLGVLEQILETGANDVYIVRGEGKEHLIPAIADVVRQVDLDAHRIVIRPLPGLLDQDTPKPPRTPRVPVEPPVGDDKAPVGDDEAP
ncbi:MAG: ribosome maturation factor RimM [Chloroflexi bacterium]|nr:ribosome maturation factor RimM [Chloroflexota bacterium]